MEIVLLGILLAAVLVVLVMQAITLGRRDSTLQNFERTQERLERELREAIASSAQTQRTELSAALLQFQQLLSSQLQGFGDSNERRLGEIRSTLEQKLRELQTDNSAKLEQMRQTVDERLQSTLEQRLGASFKLVSERLEAVQRGLGEMQSLAQGVGDLKRVLSNVKTRGTWGEVQLGNLLEQLLTPEQYARNVITRPGSRDSVEFAIRLPGTQDTPVWLPIDAKFPVEDYERLIVAQERADPAGVEEASKALEARLKLESKSIRDKYLAPPHTTEFAFLYLPTEGLYAEVLRRPGLTDFLQREYRITIAGPTTLTAMLNALQMGFRTLAIEQRSSEVWVLLGSVKAEFGKFGDLLARSKKQLETVLGTMSDAESKTRTIERKLRDVEQLPTTSNSLLSDELHP